MSASESQTEATEPPVARVAVKSIVWSGLSFGVTKVLVFITTLLLARLLAPTDFGIVAAGLTIIAYLEIILDLGIGAALIYEQEKGVSSRVHTAFTLNLGICVTMFVIGWISAPWLAEFFHTPGQENVYRALFVFLILRGLGQIHDAILKRDLQYKRRAAVEISRGVTRVAVSVPMALMGFGVWSIVVGLLASELCGTALNWLLVPYRPRIQLDRSTVPALLRFGLAVTALKVFAEIGTNSDYLVVGHRMGPTELGYYNLAFRIPEMVLSNAYWVFSSIAFPVYAKTRSSGQHDLGVTMLRVLRLSTLFGLTVGAVIALCARDLVSVALGPHWQPIIVPLIILSIAMGLQSIGYASGDIFPALGRPGLLLAINTPLTFVLLAGFIIASYHGLAAVAAVHLGFTMVYGALRLIMGSRLTKTPLKEAFTAMRPAVCATAGIVALALPVRLFMPSGVGALVAILLAAAVGGLAGLLLGGRDAIAELRSVAAHATAR